MSALAVLALTLTMAPAAPAVAAGEGGYAGRVDVFAGTRPGPGTFGGGHNFPGASLPFGMVQWSPDTTPAAPHSGGYDYRDSHVSGFSLTHLSGAGCALYGDFPFLPTTEPLTGSPAAPGGGLDGQFEPGFSHAHESGRPGSYSVELNPVHGGAIGVSLTATTRTGMARFTFPRNPHASVLIDAGGSAQPDDLAAVSVDAGRREISGTASSGLFCGQRPRYRVYFAAVFSRPFAAYGTWKEGGLEAGGTTAEDASNPPIDPQRTAQAGAYATFDTQHNRVVAVRVGVSFVSVEGARANLVAESGDASFGAVAARASRRWNQALGRVRVSGGSRRHLDTFYTALYHALLAPRTFNDADGAYPGMDGAVHRVHGRTQYADLSGWDVYRTEIPLLALLVPKRAGDVARSLLADAAQSGCLPRWPYANGQSMTMVGDSADPMLAAAAAFGARFDRHAAMAAMVRGATETCRSPNGEYVERQGLPEYLQLGYVPFDSDTNRRNANSLFGDPDAVWGSAATTLEYAVDDYAIARLAVRAGEHATAGAFFARSRAWRRLFDPASGMIEPRYAAGGFPQPYDNLQGGGFVEGDSAQYTWMVPQDPRGLAAAMGGRGRAAQRLERFLRALNAGPGGTHTDHALLGNEPTLHTPWLFDWLGQPYRTQKAVRRGLSLYRPAPDGYPGNDDLGTLSAWYVFGALGLYPEVPGSDVLALASPLFRRAEVRLPHRRRAVISASGRGIYVQSLQRDGRPYARPWTTYRTLAKGADLSFELGRRPDRRWGAKVGQAPPAGTSGF
ncbi:MAG TPA: GH92 family glycosyl hydrolase [Solirubrobacterales bacterium]|nr:GH92 family glycosyl hydrolase [Solirubrobacterales bacterium]